jgi:FlaG/FlaF family flagellin (archaellin)
MVAITVILAAVIGAFVLEIGDQQETAPSTSFDSGQQLEYYESNWANGNLTTVEISHAGGNTIDISQVVVKINGNSSVWGAEHTAGSVDKAHPVPDIRETLGTNEGAEFSSGETWRMIAYNGLSHEYVRNSDCYQFHYTGSESPYFHNPGNCIRSGYSNGHIWFDAIAQGDKVNVVWTASSGGKTQTLFKYTVQ